MAFEFPFQDPGLNIEERVEDLLDRLTIDEKIGQMIHASPAVDRLGIPEYSWWNECLHGVGRAGLATVFPQAIGLAAMFDEESMQTVASAISDEARAKHHLNAQKGDRRIYKGLTYWTPNINIFRDPRWGRGQETYGECPYLTGRLGMAFVRGLQGDDAKHLKLVSTPKHFAVHSGPEGERHSFDAVVDARDLWETYLPAFRMTVVDAGAWSVMGAYNRTNGEPCCGSKLLLVDILRGKWAFSGYVVSDCWAIQDFHEHHHVTETPADSAALAVRMGCDLNCGRTYHSLQSALERGLITEQDIDVCLRRLIEARIRLGMFDPPESVVHASIPFDVIDSPRHRELARMAAEKSIVLLKNADGILPLARDARRIAVIGPNADDKKMQLGNYHGTPPYCVTPLEGIRQLAPEGTNVKYQPGCDRVGHANPAYEQPDLFFAEAIYAAEQADVVVLCVGLSSDLEGEQGDASNSDASGDRLHIGLPTIQEQLVDCIINTGTPVVLVIISGSAVSIPSACERAAAVIQQFYPGQAGGTALARVIFGKTNPGGRLPVTAYKSLADLPEFADYRMENRTYRFFGGEPLYPFGFGLSYTKYRYSGLRVSASKPMAGDALDVRVDVENAGAMPGEEVVQLYIAHEGAAVRTPIRQLVGFRRVSLVPGEKKAVEFRLAPRQLSLVADDGRSFVQAGKIRLYAGGSQPDEASRRLGAAEWVEAMVEFAGERIDLDW